MSIKGFKKNGEIHKYDYNALDNLPTLGATEEQAAQIEQNKNDIANLTAEDVGAAPASHDHAASDIISGTLPVANGGTGATTFTSGEVLVGAGTGAVTTRAITNLTAKGAVTGSTNLATANTVLYHSQNRLNRTTAVNAADTNYTTCMARGTSLHTADTNPSVNGAIAWTYK